MTTDHRTKAEELLDAAAKEFIHPDGVASVALAAAQVHATLSGNEARGGAYADLRDANRLLRQQRATALELVAPHVAAALTSKNTERWKAARDLARDFDDAGLGIEREVDELIADNGYDPKTAWNNPGTAAPAKDPWAAKPDITADVPEPVRRVLADYLAAALLSKGDAQGVAQTITFALKAAGADLTGDIEKRITELTLGRDPSELPF